MGWVLAPNQQEEELHHQHVAAAERFPPLTFFVWKCPIGGIWGISASVCQRPLILWEVNRKSQCELQLLGFNTANLIHVSDA